MAALESSRQKLKNDLKSSTDNCVRMVILHAFVLIATQEEIQNLEKKRR